MNPTDPTARFEQLYAQSTDPWNYHSSLYERAKYRATLSAIPDERQGRCLEVGCSIGVFTKMLAARCETVLAIDFSPRAVALAAGTLAGIDNVELRTAAFPEEAPSGPWDLIICSEVLYYLNETRLRAAIEWLAEQLTLGACVVAVSWRGLGKSEAFLGDEVHERLVSRFSDCHTLDARDEGYRLDRFEAAKERGRVSGTT